MVERWKKSRGEGSIPSLLFFYSIFLMNKEDTYEYRNCRFSNKKDRIIHDKE